MSADEPLKPIAPRRGLFGPVVRWELVTIPRGLPYFLIRALYAIVLLGALWATYMATFDSYTIHRSQIALFARFGANFFQAYTGVLFVSLVLITPAFVAGGIAGEKERRTLDYLFASDLTSREIVLGKLAARSLNLVAILLAGAPVVAFAGLFGGVGYVSLLAVTVGSLATLLALAALSMVVSVHSRTTRQALTTTYSLVAIVLVSPLVVMAGVELVEWIIQERFPSYQPPVRTFLHSSEFATTCQFLLLLHPLAMVIVSLEPGMVLRGSMVTGIGQAAAVNILGNLLVAILLTGVAVYRLRRAYRFESSETSARVGWRRRLFRPVPRYRPAVWQSAPLAWKELFTGSHGSLGCLVRGLILLGGGVYYAMFLASFWQHSPYWHSVPRSFDPRDINQSLRVGTWVFALLAYVFVAFRSATAISHERDRDCWVSLLSTPLSGRQIVLSKWLGSMAPIGWLWLYLFPLWLLAWYADALKPIGIVYSMGVMVIHGGALSSLGILQSLWRKTSLRAIVTTLAISAAASGGIQALLVPTTGPSRELGKVIVGSLPWYALYMSPVLEEEPSRASRYFQTLERDRLGYVFVFLIFYSAVGVILLMTSLAFFAKTTGRTERAIRFG